jgi:hypothetical protein
MNVQNMNGQWGDVVELSLDELALVNGGSVWSVIKDAANWVANHTDDIGKAISTGEKIVDAGKQVIAFFRKIF